MKRNIALAAAFALLCFGAATFAQQPPEPPPSEAGELEKLRQEAERARLEAEKAKAEAERARAEAARSRAEAEALRMEREGRRALPAPKKATRRTPPPGYYPMPGFHIHDGFFLRFTLGLGFGGYNSSGHLRLPGTSLMLTDPEERNTIAGGSLSLGGSIAPNLIIHGDLWGAGLLGDFDNNAIEDFTLGVIGAGVTYYFMPENMYLTASLGVASCMAKLASDAYYYRRDEVEEIGSGVALALTFGKEWWTSPNWGIGLALNAYFAYLEGEDISLRMAGFKLLFSATFN